jgi:hypothetical protein
MNDTKKTEAQKQLIKFQDQLHKLLMRHPDIRIGVDRHGYVVAFIPEGDRPRVYLPTNGKQELIKH